LPEIDNKIEPDFEASSVEESEVLKEESEHNSSSSLSSRLLNYRLKNPSELNQTLYSRI